ncbi:MucBP domain-containing protein [Fructilactobacillus vespulae]|uniref:mucin-binding protein n=1 Tax=Fructilactobacillus vespulae TaxID=1249630 RepID=UPI0039B3A83D
MLYNKKQINKTNEKKVLRKVKKNWVVVSAATFMFFGSLISFSTEQKVSASDSNPSTSQVKVGSSASGEEGSKTSDNSVASEAPVSVATKSVGSSSASEAPVSVATKTADSSVASEAPVSGATKSVGSSVASEAPVSVATKSVGSSVTSEASVSGAAKSVDSSSASEASVSDAAKTSTSASTIEKKETNAVDGNVSTYAAKEDLNINTSNKSLDSDSNKILQRSSTDNLFTYKVSDPNYDEAGFPYKDPDPNHYNFGYMKVGTYVNVANSINQNYRVHSVIFSTNRNGDGTVYIYELDGNKKVIGQYSLVKTGELQNSQNIRNFVYAKVSDQNFQGYFDNGYNPDNVRMQNAWRYQDHLGFDTVIGGLSLITPQLVEQNIEWIDEKTNEVISVKHEKAISGQVYEITGFPSQVLENKYYISKKAGNDRGIVSNFGKVGQEFALKFVNGTMLYTETDTDGGMDVVFKNNDGKSILGIDNNTGQGRQYKYHIDKNYNFNDNGIYFENDGRFIVRKIYVEQNRLIKFYVSAVGKLVPKDVNGNEIDNGKYIKEYPVDPKNDYTNVDNPIIPDIPGKTPIDKDGNPLKPGDTFPIDKNHPGEDSKLVYVNTDQRIKVSYVDKDTNQSVKEVTLTGKPGEKSSYSTSDELKELENKGYEVVTDGYPSAGVKFGTNDKDQEFKVVVKHKQTPVTPDTPGTPGQPVDPNNPTGPKYPAGTDLNSLRKVITQTINYVDEKGNEVHVPSTQTVTFERNATFDQVTGNVTYSEWKSSDTNFSAKTSPVVNGYYLKNKDQMVIPAKGVTAESANDTETVVYEQVGKLTPVDTDGNPLQPEVKYPNNPADPSEPTNPIIPDIPGKTPIDKDGNPLKPGDTFPIDKNHPGEDSKLVYVNTDQRIKVSYVDKDTNQSVKEVTLTGKPGEKSSYSTSDELKELENKGYEVVTDGYPSSGVKFGTNDKDQVFKVVVKHKQTPVTPDTPGTPGQPVDPNNPTGPKYPAGTDLNSLRKVITQTINYVDEKGNEVHVPSTQTVTFERNATFDQVTGNVTYSEWKSSDANFSAKTSPVVNGYYLKNKDQMVIPAKGVTAESANETATVVYEQVGKLTPVDTDGNPLQPEVKYPNNPADPSEPANPIIPDIPGKTPIDKDGNPLKPGDTFPIDKNHPGEDSKLVYVNTDQRIKVSYVDKDTNQPVKEVTLTGKPGEKSNYSTSDELKELENKGYEVVTDGYPSTGVKFGTNDKDQEFKVVVKHKQTPVTPDTPGTPGQPVDPNNPTGPKYPAGTDLNSLRKVITQTINYVDEKGNEVHVPSTQTVTFERNATFDQVTGNVTYGAWVAKDGENSFSAKTSPVVNGYYLKNKDQMVIPAKTVNADSANDTETVVYEQVGKLTPVDTDGNPLQPEVKYPNNPADPSEPTNPIIPDIPGKTPIDKDGNPLKPGDEFPINPSKPGEDSKLVYVNTDQRIKVSYVDKDTNQPVKEVTLTGKPGEKSNYSTSDELKELENKGYEVVTDGYPSTGVKFGTNDKDQEFKVVVKHKQTPVTPDTPGTPGQPVDPNNPTGPKYPAGTDLNSLRKVITQTINYVDEKGNEVHVPSTQTVTFERNATFDQVTGNVTYGAWVAKDGKTSFSAKTSPVVSNYFLKDKEQTVIAAKTVTTDSANDTETVVYKQVGKLIPVDPNGNPLQPGIDYPNNPNNPGEVNYPIIPEIPGKMPIDKNGNPLKPGDPFPIDKNHPGENITITYIDIPEVKVIPKEDGKVENNPEIPVNKTVATPKEETAKQTAKETPQAKTLPQTGQSDSSTLAIIGSALISLFGIFGLGALRKKNEDK